MDTIFTPIDIKTWPMAQTFYYYTQIAPVTYTVNDSMDVTIMRKMLKEKGIKFFPAYLYIVTRAISSQQELRMAKKDDVLGYWDCLTPAYPQFHEDDKTTSLLWTEYDRDFMTFYSRYIEDTGKYGKDHGTLTSKGIPPANSYIISCIPWFTFNSFSLHIQKINDYYVPSLEAGAFHESGGRIMMPLSVTVHHATTEGYHLKLFFEEIQHAMDNPETWLLQGQAYENERQ
jgi:chloramphenicol O-acetyltransferase type A